MAKKLAFDKLLFSAVVALLGFGLVMVYSASAGIARTAGPGLNPFAAKQAVAACLGLVLMGIVMHLRYAWLKRPWVVYLGIGGTLAALIVALFSPSLNEAHRWVFVAGVSIQPSELAKLALVVFLAYQVDRKHDRVNQPEFLIPVSVVAATTLGLIVFEPDLSSALLLGIVVAIVLFLAGLSWRFVGLAAALSIPAVWLAILQVPYRRERALAFLDPERDPLGSGFQAAQSLIALGSGGLTGRGLGHSMQKLHFLPYPHSDYIFAIVGEELGLLGALTVVALFSVVLWRGLRAGWKAPDRLGRYLAWGFTVLIATQAFLHMSVAVSIFPSTGIPLPLITYGGSSLVTTLIACGVVLNVSQHA